MAEKITTAKKLSEKNTKQEMLEAYEQLAKQMEQKRAAELNPEKKMEEKRTDEAVKVAETLSPEGVDRAIGNLKAEIGRMLADISEKLAGEVGNYKSIQKAIESKASELQELYGIQKSAGSLAALIEAQNQKRREFEIELEDQKAELDREIETTRRGWEKEQKQREVELKEREALEKKNRDREKEEFTYLFKRDQQAMRDQFNDEKAKLEKANQQKREALVNEMADREKAVAAKESELAQFRNQVAAFPKELENAINQAVQEVTERIKLEAKNREELQRKDFEGQRNVLTTKIESFQGSMKEQADQVTKLSRQLEAAYQKVQEIAEKAIEGSSQAKSFAELQKLLADQSRKIGAEKS